MKQKDGKNISEIIEANKVAWQEAASFNYENESFSFTKNGLSGGILLNNWLRSRMAERIHSNGCVLQFGCNWGHELLSALSLGFNRGIGIDISERYLKEGRKVANSLELDAEFIVGDNVEIGGQLKEVADIVFITSGTLCWMPNLREFFCVAHKCLKRNGTFLISEAHPLIYLLGSDREASALHEKGQSVFCHSYFARGPIRQDHGLGYYTENVYKGREAFWFMHTVSDIVSNILLANMDIREFHESSSCVSYGYRKRAAKFPELPFSINIAATRGQTD